MHQDYVSHRSKVESPNDFRCQLASGFFEIKPNEHEIAETET